MKLETTTELAETLADWIGIYDCCKNVNEGDDNCTYDEEKPFCCRMGFVQAIEKRMKQAVENDKILEQLMKIKED